MEKSHAHTFIHTYIHNNNYYYLTVKSVKTNTDEKKNYKTR